MWEQRRRRLTPGLAERDRFSDPRRSENDRSRDHTRHETQLDLRPLLRADLELVHPGHQKRSTRWLARDPISLKFYLVWRFASYRVIAMFQGTTGRSPKDRIRMGTNATRLIRSDELELRQFVLSAGGLKGVLGFSGSSVSAPRTQERLQRNVVARLSMAGLSPFLGDSEYRSFDPTALLQTMRLDSRTVLSPRALAGFHFILRFGNRSAEPTAVMVDAMDGSKKPFEQTIGGRWDLVFN